ncbi:MAG: Gfo/Idh/MocA family oxidoreductase [candidate division WS1 bacterium]|nr:Gfo/Idh/MocA family oxidoreductase [candidate division WS1 bacterium]
MTSQGKLRVAQIGASGRAPLHMRAFVESRRVTAVFLAESDDAAREALERPWGLIKRTVSDYHELLTDDSVDLVNLSLPAALAPEVAEEALRAGKPVILESPPAASLRAFDRLVQTAEATGQPLFIQHHQLTHPALRRAQDLLDQGELGSLRLGSCTIMSNHSPAQDPPHLAALYQGAYVLEYFLGSAQTVLGESLPVSAGALLTYADSTLGQIAITRVTDGAVTQEVTLVGSEGTLLAREAPDDELPLVLTRGGNTVPLHIPLPLDVSPWLATRMMESLLDCLCCQQDPPPFTLAQARSALATALAIQDAAQLRLRVRIF